MRCTCHPDDRPPGRCRKKYAASECRKDWRKWRAECFWRSADKPPQEPDFKVDVKEPSDAPQEE